MDVSAAATSFCIESFLQLVINFLSKLLCFVTLSANLRFSLTVCVLTSLSPLWPMRQVAPMCLHRRAHWHYLRRRCGVMSNYFDQLFYFMYIFHVRFIYAMLITIIINVSYVSLSFCLSETDKVRMSFDGWSSGRAIFSM